MEGLWALKGKSLELDFLGLRMKTKKTILIVQSSHFVELKRLILGLELVTASFFFFGER